MINNSSIQEYYLVFSIYEPVVKPNSITDIYLKVDDEWVKDDEGVLYGENEPNAALGKDGNLYLKMATTGGDARILDGFEVEDFPGTVSSGVSLTDIDTISVHVVSYSEGSQQDERTVTVTKQEILNAPGGEYPITRPQMSNVMLNLKLDSHDDLYFMLPDSYHTAVVDIDQISPEPTGEVTNISDIYLKVDGEWIKDEFGKDTEVTAILYAGQTYVSLQSDAITTDSTFDIYTSIWGAEPTDVTVASGSITLTFEEQETDMNVKVKVS